MKKLVFAFLLISGVSNAQIKFVDKESFNFSLAIDPTATIKENSPNLVAELELVSYWKYVKASVQIFPALQGGYLDIAGGLGLNLTSGYFNTVRYYGGVRLGVIKRGMSENKTYTYPLAGIEGGINYNLSETVFVGVRGTGDYRSDFLYSGADPSIRYSGFVKIGFNL